MKHHLLLIGFLVAFTALRSQEPQWITKDEVLVKMIENNTTLKMAESDVMAAQGDFRQTNATILPNIGISHTGIATTNPLMAFGSKLNQSILTANDFDPNLLNNPRQIEDYATRLTIEQPLLNFDGIYQRKAAKAKLLATELQSQRTGQ